MQKRYVILVAGGSGTRMGTVLPKQFLEVNGKPVLLHTLERFYSTDPEFVIIIVLPSDHHDTWKEILKTHHIQIPHILVSGGETRFHSVKNGIAEIEDNEGLVAIHDGVRPLVSSSVILQAFQEAAKFGNAIPAIPLNDSIRELDGDKNKIADRNKFRLIQTPQTFKISIIKKAFLQSFSSEFTDDASVVEKNGEKIHLFEGNPENIKITTPSDLIIFKSLCQNIR